MQSSCHLDLIRTIKTVLIDNLQKIPSIEIIRELIKPLQCLSILADEKILEDQYLSAEIELALTAIADILSQLFKEKYMLCYVIMDCSTSSKESNANICIMDVIVTFFQHLFSDTNNLIKSLIIGRTREKFELLFRVLTRHNLFVKTTAPYISIARYLAKEKDRIGKFHFLNILKKKIHNT
jgi:hypothetical protein